GVGAVPDFRVGVEESESRVGGGYAGCRLPRPRVSEQELAVLIVRACRAGLYIDFVVVVLARALIQYAEFHAVAPLDPGKTVGNIVDGSRRVGGVRAAAQL